jgi:hypothetical protein
VASGWRGEASLMRRGLLLSFRLPFVSTHTRSREASLFVMVETEIWPNLLENAAAAT